MNIYCGNCEEIRAVEQKKEIREYQIKETKVSAEITILTCTHCHEEVYDRNTAIANDILLFDEYKKKNNLLTSSDIIKIREKYHLSQATFSKIMGFGLKTITRYENGSIQDYTHDNLMRLVESEDNFYALWQINKRFLTAPENAKISSKFQKRAITTVIYEIKDTYFNPYTTTITGKGGQTYDGCQ